jgi:hypothetical protein
MTGNFSKGNPDVTSQIELLLVKPGAVLNSRDTPIPTSRPCDP